MKIAVPEKLNMLAKSLPKPLYVVGGVCRDALANLKTDGLDWDICAPLSALEVATAAKDIGIDVVAVYKNTGTVKLEADGQVLEYTCFRTDKYVRGMHSPVSVCFTDDITLDARRRDFKCNAVYYDIVRGEYVDPLGGIADIGAGRLTTVAAPEKVFGEDGLRLMRLARIAAQTGFKPTKECVEGASANASLIKDVAAERIWAELNLILSADVKYGVKGGQYAGLKLLEETGVLGILLPELTLGKGMSQRSDFHDYDVLEHSLRAVLYAELPVRLAALLHDVGKPYCKINYNKFSGHEEVGRQMSKDICARLKVPNRLAERVSQLVGLHMYDLNCAAAENKVRKFIVNHYEAIDELLLVKQADYSACKDDLSQAPCVKKWNKIIGKMKEEGVPFTLKQLAIKGNELIDGGICADQVGKTLKFLLEQTAMGCIPNQREKLLSMAKKHVCR
ncbi:MAG: CCA tRNA nucleotidyltransferase [Candidatus Coproplasma sp.]